MQISICHKAALIFMYALSFRSNIKKIADPVLHCSRNNILYKDGFIASLLNIHTDYFHLTGFYSQLT